MDMIFPREMSLKLQLLILVKQSEEFSFYRGAMEESRCYTRVTKLGIAQDKSEKLLLG